MMHVSDAGMEVSSASPEQAASTAAVDQVHIQAETSEMSTASSTLSGQDSEQHIAGLPVQSEDEKRTHPGSALDKLVDSSEDKVLPIYIHLQ